MDPSRHHEYIGSNEERSRANAAAAAAYYNREVPDIASHRYYGSTVSAAAPPPQQQQQQQQQPPAPRSLSNTRNHCDCTTTPSGARITCNSCRLNPSADIWPSMASSTLSSSNPASEQHHSQRGDYRQMVNEASMRSNMRQSPMYMQQQQQQHQHHPPPNQHMQHQQQQQPPPLPPHVTQGLSHGPPPPTQSMVQQQQQHPSHAVSRTNYWPQNPSSTSQHYGDEQHMSSGGGGGLNHPAQSTTQTQIDISITRRSAAAPSGPVEGNMYGQYKTASMTATATHPSHSSSSYPPPPSSSNPLHQRGISAIGGGPGPTAPGGVGGAHYITKERIYETKYSSTTTTTKITSSATYDNHHHMNNVGLSGKSSSSAALPIDHHVINPSNLPASKEQHPSPNYARKCPQMYTPEAEQSTAHHHHLYMPTPQFSSDKFSRASPQQGAPDYTKLRESPLQSSAAGGSPYMVTGDKYQQHMPPTHLRESPQFVMQQQQQQLQQPSVSRNPNSYYNPNQNPSKVHPPEMSPIIMKQSHAHYQYSKSPLPPPLPPSAAVASHQMHQIPPAPNMGAKTNASSSALAPPPPGNHHPPPPPPTQRYIMDNVKREDLEIYENHPTHMQQQSLRNSGSGMYINPYNTPPPTGDTCCKEVTPLSASSSPYTTGSATPNYRVESPQFYTTKYGKMSMSDSSNKQHTLINQNTPPPSRAPSQRGHQQPAYYYESNPHSAPSPAAATAASPSPSSSLLSSSTSSITSQTQIHHTEYVTTLQGGPPIGPPPPGHTLSQSYPTQPTAQHQSTTAASLRNNEMLVGSQNPSLSYERSIPHHPHAPHPHSQAQPTKPPQHPGALPQNSVVQVQSANQQQHHHASKIPANAAASNKHKPNYRELISRTLAMRNATSEEELNMQIIKKTLNVDSQNIRGAAVNPQQPPPPAMANNARGVGGGPPVVHSGHQLPNLHDRLPIPIRSDMAPGQAPPSTTKPPPMGSSVLVNHNSAVPLLPRAAESSRICIKQEDDKPSSSSATTTTTTTSPLDLSMRTVKTKADSTEYKYQQRRLTPSSTNEGRYTLPRVDSTPVFSVHAFEPAAAIPAAVVDITGGSSSSRPSPQNSRHNSLDRRNYTPPTQPSNIPTTPQTAKAITGGLVPAASYSQSSAHANQMPRRMELHQTTPGGSIITHPKDAYEPSYVIKTAPKPLLSERDLLRGNVSQSRPSVLETNPYASVIKTEPKRTPDPPIHIATQAAAASSTHHTLAAVERLPPDTSIMALPPRNSYNLQRSVGPPPVANAGSSLVVTPPNYSQGCERNPNFRKRHIQEYSSQMSATEPIIKQSRYIDAPPSVLNAKPVIPMRPADISVIAVNESNQHELERAQKAAKQMDMAPISTTGGVIASTTINVVVQPAPVIVNNHNHMAPAVVVCKQEPLTPTAEVPPKLEVAPLINQTITTTTNTSQQPSSQMASSRIRTKAELKGFTFNPPPLAQTEIEPPPVVAIKQEELPPVKVKEEEPETTVDEELPSIPGLEDNFSESNLLDFGWSNTCNNFVEQLKTRPPAKKKPLPAAAAAINKTPIKECHDVVVSSTDVANRKPLENHFSNMESADTTRSSFARFDGLESGHQTTMKSSSLNHDPLNSPSSSSLVHKKLNKIGREKKRFQQEKRLAERLQSKESSSESEDELDKRKTERLKKPLMKSKIKLKSKSGNSNDNNSSSNQLNEKNHFSDCGSDSSSETEAEVELSNNIKHKSLSSPKKENTTTTNEKAILVEIKQENPQEKEEEEGKCDKPVKLKNKEEDTATTKPKPEKEQENLSKKSSSLSSSPTTKEDKLLVSGGKKGTSTPNKTESKKASSSSSSSDGEEEEEDEEENEEEEREEEADKAATKSTKTDNKSSKQVNITCSSSKGGKFKVGLNTMTRSKLKKEMELQLANSKVLRNDKIIRNSTTKIKRKYVRKYVNNVNSYLESGGLSRESGVMKSTRLKAKLERKVNALNLLKAKDKKTNKLGNNKDSGGATKNPKSENVHDRNVIDFIHFKRALKVPPSLISIKHPGAHKIAASLPDLERHAEALDAYAKKKKKSNFKSDDKQKTDKSASVKAKAATENESGGPGDEPRSIIDVLHSRVTKASGLLIVSSKPTTTTACKPNKTSQTNTTTKTYSTTNNCGMFSETSQTTESSELQMLPPLKQDSEEDEDDDNESATSAKKRHFSIFDTTVLPTKTRTESKLQQKRENIREIFVGDDRPASAPPEMIQAPDTVGEKMTYEQKYEQFLQQMNIVISADKFGRFGRTAAARKLILPTQQTSSSLNIKQEEVDTESTSVMDPDELKEDQKSETTQAIRKKRGKYLRRKGSSGFDYIRKKKKPTSSAISSAMHNHNSTNSSFHHISIKAEKMEADEYENKVKTEDDVSREIQKWVLNKGVGQSTMHKAARQGYIDVIVYCLERMAMNPDQKDNAGYTPLHEACTNGWLDIARVLLQYGANHSAAAHSGIRPLHEASENDHEEIVRLLLSHGADPLLATYSGQTPLMLASSTTMRDILNNHLVDVQSMGPDRKPWKFNGPWEIYDPSECGYNVFEGAPNPLCDMSRALFRRGSLTNNQMMMQSKKLQQQQSVLNTNNINIASSNANAAIATSTSNSTNSSNHNSQNGPTNSSAGGGSVSGTSGSSNNTSGTLKASEATVMTTTTTTTTQQQPQKGETSTKTVMDKCAVVLDKIDHFNSVRLNTTDKQKKSEILVENSDSDGEMFEFEEADILLPPLYLLKDEGTNDKWVLLSDLCNLLKVKSKDTLLNKIYPPSSSAASAHKSLMRELKMSDFLEKATCLQLLCAGEKLNICASKVVLIKYNENVRNLLGVNTILMKF